jgi:hypothetical protein
MVAKPPERTHGDVARTPDDEREAVREEFVPEAPKDEVREVARGQAPRTPFSLVLGIALIVFAVAASVTGLVVLAIWLA